MKDFAATIAAFVGSVVEEAKEHSAGLLFSANCLLWFLAGFLAEKVI